MAKATLEKVKMYKVSPSWGNKNLRVMSERCVMSGKTLMCKTKRWRSAGELCKTPLEAVNKRIEHCEKYLEDIQEDKDDTLETIKQLKLLKKEIK